MKKKLSVFLAAVMFMSGCNSSEMSSDPSSDIIGEGNTSLTESADGSSRSASYAESDVSSAETSGQASGETSVPELPDDNGSPFAAYYNNYIKETGYLPYGVLIDDINGDGRDEMVMQLYSSGYMDILYIKNGELKVINCPVMSEWGNTWYDESKNRIINQYFYGHTQGTAGAYEYNVYDWNGEDYILTMHLNRQAGYFEREADGVTPTDNFIDGQSYLNGEAITNEKFEELLGELKEHPTSEDLFEVVKSGSEIFKPDEEQAEKYKAYLDEKLYNADMTIQAAQAALPQMNFCEIDHHFSNADLLQPKPQNIRAAKLDLDDKEAAKPLDKGIEKIALDHLRASKRYLKTAEALKKSQGRYTVGGTIADAETNDNFEPVISVRKSYSLDFDGNGKDEHFVILRYLDLAPEFVPYETDCCVYVSDKGTALLLIRKSVELTMDIIRGDGICHIAFEAGCNDTTSFFKIYSVKNGKPCVELEEWKALSVSNGEIILTNQMNRYCAAYDLDAEKYVLYSFGT